MSYSCCYLFMKFIWTLLTVFFCYLDFSFSLENKLSDKQASILVEPFRKAGENSSELRSAIARLNPDRAEGLVFLIQYMPERDLKSLSSDYLVENVNYAFKAREDSEWAKSVPKDIFLNDVLPYANINERRDQWRKDFYERFSPLVKECKSLEEAAQVLNKEIWKIINVKYHARKRPKPDQSPYESIDAGFASCTGLSVILIDACRAVGVPARFVGTPMWAKKRGNHSWVEVWDGKDWKFTGACEYSAAGLGNAWFKGDASNAIKDDPRHAIYAASWKKTEANFPLIWDLNINYVFAENVTDNYTGKKSNRVFIQLFSKQGGDRISSEIQVWKNEKKIASGRTRDENNDTNDMLAFSLKKGDDYELRIPIKGSKELVKPFEVSGQDNEQILFYLAE
ncbi:MAG: transglutaminase [Verrucomicrobiaceae bacterium]|nr:transglutaminase [Verrucomicrobiaceae bacterium]